jgi:uncharacterized protein (DUF2336 family)
MSATVSENLIDEFELVLKEGSAEWRVRTLRQLSELMGSCVERLNTVQIDIFDDMLIRLLDCVGTAALAELSSSMADFARPPTQTIHQLARHKDPVIAGPLLSKSPVLIEADLIEIAKTRSQQHLVAVAGRNNLSAQLTDVILKMAARDASLALARNPSARLSKAGLIVLLAKAKGDETIAEALGLRPDLPPAALRELLSKATPRARARLLKAAPAELKQRIQVELDSIEVPAKPVTNTPMMDSSDAHAAVAVLSRTGKLNDSTVNRFAIKQEHANVVAALVLLSGASVETIAPLMDEAGGEGLIVACRASRLNWQTTSAILNNRRVPPLSKQQLEDGRQMFEMLFVSTAQYSIRFETPRGSAATPAQNAASPVAVGASA